MDRLEDSGVAPRWVPVSELQELRAQCQRLSTTVQLYEQRHVQLQREHAAELERACRLLWRLMKGFDEGECHIVDLHEAESFLERHGWRRDDDTL